MESFLGISRLGTGGKHFPGMFCAAAGREQQPGCPCSPGVDGDRRKPVAVAV